MHVLYSPRGKRPIGLRLTSTTCTAPLDTLTRFYSARPRSSKGSFASGSCRSTDSRYLSSAMPTTGKPIRSVCLKGAQLTPPRPRQGGPKARRAVHLKGCGGRLPGPGREGRKRDEKFAQGNAVYTSSTPARRTQRETIGSSQGGAVDASSAPAGRAESKSIGSSQGGAVDASSAPAGKTEGETIGSLTGLRWPSSRPG